MGSAHMGTRLVARWGLLSQGIKGTQPGEATAAWGPMVEAGAAQCWGGGGAGQGTPRRSRKESPVILGATGKGTITRSQTKLPRTPLPNIGDLGAPELQGPGDWTLRGLWGGP